MKKKLKASTAVAVKQPRLSLKRQYNKALILNCVRKCSPISRTKIRALTRIRLASITELARLLSQEGYLCEAGVKASRRGRKQALLRLNASNGFAVGLEYGPEHVVAVLVDLEANVLARTRVVIRGCPERNMMIQSIIQAAGEMIGRPECDRGKLVGVGIADPGVIDSRHGISLFATTIKRWRNVPLQRMLEKALHLPVFMEEELRAKALCEVMFGGAREIDNLMFIGIGAGVGCGVIINGSVYRGATESSGELGHTRVMDGGPLCACGQRGCLEAVASFPAIARQAALAIRQGKKSRLVECTGRRKGALHAKHVFLAARQGDALALGIVNEAVKWLGIGIANAVNLFNPEMIIFEGTLREVEDIIVAPLIRHIRQQALTPAARKLKFRISLMGEWGGAIAASTLAIDRVFAIPQLPIPDYLKKT